MAAQEPLVIHAAQRSKVALWEDAQQIGAQVVNIEFNTRESKAVGPLLNGVHKKSTSLWRGRNADLLSSSVPLMDEET
jgi:hypothetical protein